MDDFNGYLNLLLQVRVDRQNNERSMIRSDHGYNLTSAKLEVIRQFARHFARGSAV